MVTIRFFQQFAPYQKLYFADYRQNGSLRNIAAYPREILSTAAENPRCFPCHPEARGKGFQFCSAGDSPQNSQFAAERLQSSCQVGAYGEKSSSPCHRP